MLLLVLAGLMAASALTVDMGNLYYSYQELLANTQAAAEAAGAAMGEPDVANVTTVAYQYSGATGSTYNASYNVHPNLNITSVSVSAACVNPSTYTGLGLPPCTSYPSASAVSGCSTSCNALQVTEQAKVPMFFMKFFGLSSLNISAIASASASGGGAIPYHIMMILDSTASMGSGSDTGCNLANLGASYTPEGCAQQGVQILLNRLAPCAIDTTCTSSNSTVDQVGLMTFPGLCDQAKTGETTANCNPTSFQATSLNNTTANSVYAPDDYNCLKTDPKIPIAAYNNDPQYLILGFPTDPNFSSDAPYRTSDTGSLNTSSDLYNAVNAATTYCGIQTPGGMSTFYAGVIVAAQQYLQTYHTSGIQDVIIFLSDGNANATGATGNVAAGNGNGQSQMAGSVKQTVTGISGMSGGLWQGTNDCAQAVAAANWVKTQKESSDGTYTEIYSVSYNSQNVNCTNDTPTITDCTTMLDIASNPTAVTPHYFFSVPGKTGTVCSGAVPVKNLASVFNVLATDLSSARLIPNGSF
jgi:hypothetical protein